MEKIKQITKYIIIFVMLVFVLTLLLVIVAKIPRKYVENNLKEATSYFRENNWEVTRTQRKREYTYLHPYADEIILNIIYCLDTEKPLESVLEAKYYTKFQNDGSNEKYIELIENDLQANTEYLRYWHGSILIIKPLLAILTLEQIYILNAITISILAGILIILLIKRKYYPIAISIILGLIMVAIWYVPFCFEYVWTFILMLITSILSVKIETNRTKNKNEKLYILYFITGVLTCFFDFLTTEIITILVPVAIVLSIRIKEKRFESLKKELIFLIKSIFLWLIAYSFMWIAKWIIASIVLKVNAMDFVKDKAMIRINGEVMGLPLWETMLRAIKENFLTIYPINIIKRKKWILLSIFVALIVSLVLVIDRKNKEKMKYMILMLIIGIIPYLRYITLSNHSFRHSFFTFRSQLPTIMCIVLIFANCIDKKKLLSKIKIGKDKNGK